MTSILSRTSYHKSRIAKDTSRCCQRTAVPVELMLILLWGCLLTMAMIMTPRILINRRYSSILRLIITSISQRHSSQYVVLTICDLSCILLTSHQIHRPRKPQALQQFPRKLHHTSKSTCEESKTLDQYTPWTMHFHSLSGSLTWSCNPCPSWSNSKNPLKIMAAIFTGKILCYKPQTQSPQ